MALGFDQKHSGIITLIATLLFLSSSLALIGASGNESGEGDESKVFIYPSKDKVKVTINNALGGGVWANVHCKSKDDDLNSRTLAPNKGFDFSFQPNFWGSTLYFCHVTWHWPGNDQSHFFDAYSFARDRNRCLRGTDHCCWNIKPSGPCACNNANNCLKWK